MGSVGTTANKPYDSFDKTITDTLIVERDGKYRIEQYNGQDLDTYEHTAEMNHSKLLEYRYQDMFFMNGITLDDIYRYLIDNYNLAGVKRR